MPTPLRRATAPFAAALLFAAPGVARAQVSAAPDSASPAATSQPSTAPVKVPAVALPFRPGQWGGELTVSGRNGIDLEAGLLRFLSPRSAIVLAADGDFWHRSAEQPDYAGTDAEKDDGNNALLRLRLGYRGYTPTRFSFARYTTLGVSVTHVNQTLDTELPGSTGKYSYNGVGLFGELGATYFVTPALGIGASGILSAEYARWKSTLSPDGSVGVSETTSKDSQFDLRGSLVRLTASVYF